jgi:hypothetical protein
MYLTCLECRWAGLLLVTLWNLPSGRYNIILRGLSRGEVVEEMLWCFGFAALEMPALAMTCIVVFKKYGISPLHLLAFLLEQQYANFQTKLTSCFIALIFLTSVHQGSCRCLIVTVTAIVLKSLTGPTVCIGRNGVDFQVSCWQLTSSFCIYLTVWSIQRSLEFYISCCLTKTPQELPIAMAAKTKCTRTPTPGRPTLSPSVSPCRCCTVRRRRCPLGNHP